MARLILRNRVRGMCSVAGQIGVKDVLGPVSVLKLQRVGAAVGILMWTVRFCRLCSIRVTVGGWVGG